MANRTLVVGIGRRGNRRPRQPRRATNVNYSVYFVRSMGSSRSTSPIPFRTAGSNGMPFVPDLVGRQLVLDADVRGAVGQPRSGGREDHLAVVGVEARVPHVTDRVVAVVELLEEVGVGGHLTDSHEAVLVHPNNVPA